MNITEIIIEIIFAYLTADILVAFGHWFEDNYINYCIDNKLFRQIAINNEMHHYFPREMTAYSYYKNMQVTFILSVITMILLFLILGNKFIFKHPYFFISLFIFITISNLFHRFSHERDCEKYAVVEWLQNAGIILTHEHHRIHHMSNIGEKYAVLNDYTNYIYDNIGLWRGLENIIYTLTGVKPNRIKSYNDYNSIHTELHKDAKTICPKKLSSEEIVYLKEQLDKMYNCKN